MLVLPSQVEAVITHVPSPQAEVYELKHLAEEIIPLGNQHSGMGPLEALKTLDREGQI
jgi:hypothetical protein